MNCFFFFLFFIFIFYPHRLAICYLADLCMYKGWTGKSGVLQSMGSQRVGHDWATELNWTEGGFTGGANGKEHTCHWRRCKRYWFDSWVGKIPWRRAWQPTPVFLPGESLEQRSLVGYCPIGSHRVEHNSSNLAHMHACTCMYRCIWEKLWVYIVFMWPIYQLSSCAPSIAFSFFKFFWKNWVLRLEFFILNEFILNKMAVK